MSHKRPYRPERYSIYFHAAAINGINLNVSEAGEGPPVFLLPGFPECWASRGAADQISGGSGL